MSLGGSLFGGSSFAGPGSGVGRASPPTCPVAAASDAAATVATTGGRIARFFPTRFFPTRFFPARFFGASAGTTTRTITTAPVAAVTPTTDPGYSTTADA